jgi:hypothetical protein
MVVIAQLLRCPPSVPLATSRSLACAHEWQWKQQAVLEALLCRTSTFSLSNRLGN